MESHKEKFRASWTSAAHASSPEVEPRSRASDTRPSVSEVAQTNKGDMFYDVLFFFIFIKTISLKIKVNHWL